MSAFRHTCPACGYQVDLEEDESKVSTCPKCTEHSPNKPEPVFDVQRVK